MKDQAETKKQVSAFFFGVVVALLLALCFIAPGYGTEPPSLADSLPDSAKPAREGMIGARDILVKIASDTVFLADTLGETLLVTIDAQGTDISGFDFTFAYDLRGVEIYNALPGDFPDSCNWEYFIVRRNPRCDGPCPSGLIKVIALAEFQELERPKLCNTPAPGASLVKLLVRPTGETPKLSSGPLRFFWIDCGDNSISSVSGNDLFVSRSVTDVDSIFQSLANATEFPSYSGPISDCFEKLTLNPPRRKIRYTNGTLTILSEAPEALKAPEADSLR